MLCKSYNHLLQFLKGVQRPDCPPIKKAATEWEEVRVNGWIIKTLDLTVGDHCLFPFQTDSQHYSF